MGQMGIGEFSRRSRLSLKALRLYGELGLLVLARTWTRATAGTTPASSKRRAWSHR
jgi:hypothetical protein